MPLRLLEVTIPRGELEQLHDLLKQSRAVHIWTSGPADATDLARILVDAQDTETVSDLLVRQFGSRENFRLVLLPVEATAPAVEEPSTAKTADGTDAGSIKVGPRRISREELYDDVAEASRLTRVYVVMVSLSTVVAAVGLVRGDVAIIIGAMVIAPLLGPNIALSLASTLGDPELAKRSLKAIAAGVATAAALSLLFGALLAIDPASPELAARTRPAVGDIVLALAAGAAGSLAFTSGVPAVVVGVMVAVALLPPLVAAGLLAGAGYGRAALGALILALTNVTCINLAAVATFLLQRVRPRTWWDADRAKRSTKRAVTTWVLMLAVLVGLILSGFVGGI